MGIWAESAHFFERNPGQPGYFIRTFLDMGDRMVVLLRYSGYGEAVALMPSGAQATAKPSH
jgi:hypothetical protein